MTGDFNFLTHFCDDDSFCRHQTVPKLVYKLFEISVYFFICIFISYFLHLSQHGKETLSKICHFFNIIVFLLLCKILYYIYCNSCFTISKCPNTILLPFYLFNSISIAHVTMLYAHWQAAVPAQFQILCLKAANVFGCVSRMLPQTTCWEYKCSSVDTAGYTDA